MIQLLYNIPVLNQFIVLDDDESDDNSNTEQFDDFDIEDALEEIEMREDFISDDDYDDNDEVDHDHLYGNEIIVHINRDDDHQASPPSWVPIIEDNQWNNDQDDNDSAWENHSNNSDNNQDSSAWVNNNSWENNDGWGTQNINDDNNTEWVNDNEWGNNNPENDNNRSFNDNQPEINENESMVDNSDSDSSENNEQIDSMVNTEEEINSNLNQEEKSEYQIANNAPYTNDELLICGTTRSIYLFDSKLNQLASIQYYSPFARLMPPLMQSIQRLCLVEYIPELSLAIVGSQGSAMVLLIRIVKYSNNTYDLLPETFIPNLDNMIYSPITGIACKKFANKYDYLSYYHLYITFEPGFYYCYELSADPISNSLNVSQKIL